MRKLKLKISLIALSGVAWLSSLPLAEASSGWSVVSDESSVTLKYEGETFSTLRHGDDLKYPFLYPVKGPASGESVTVYNTRPFPHHSSLFFSCDFVNGMNFWQPTSNLSTGQIRTTEVNVAVDTPERIVLESEHEWGQPGDDPIIRDSRQITFTAPHPTVRQMDFVFILEPLVEVTIERSNHSLFTARMAPDLAVDGGGTLLNAKGDRNQAGTFGKTASWLTAYGPRGDLVEGLAIFSHPENRWHEPRWFTRDYGNFSPTPMQWLSEPLVLPEGEPLTLRYRVWVYATEEDELPRGLEAAAADYEASDD